MKKIILPIIGLLIMSACSLGNHSADETTRTQKEVSPEMIQMIEKAKENEQKVDLTLENVNDNEIKIIINNPNKLEINSIRTFLSFNTEQIEGKEIVINEDLQNDILIAPEEDKFDNEKGLLKLGFSFKNETINSERIEVATISFEKKTDGIATLDFYDAQDGGHTEILAKIRGQLVNVLRKPENPALILGNQQ